MRGAWMLVVVVVAACGSESAPKEDKDRKETEPKDTKGTKDKAPVVDAAVAAADAAPSGSGVDAVMAWMPKNVKEAWQGAFFLKLALRDAGMASFTGSYAAIEVKGDKATAWVPATGKSYELGIELDVKPCEVTFTQRADGATDYYRKTYVVENGAVVVEGPSGYRKGKAAIVCRGSEVYVLDEQGKCRKFVERFGKWEVADAKCGWVDRKSHFADFDKTVDQTTAFVLDEGGVGNEYSPRGDVLVPQTDSHAHAGDHFSKEADFEAAKKRAEERWKATDPVEQLKSAGAKPGETKTILDFWATFKQDKAALKGKPAQLTGKVIDKVEKREVDGKTEWVLQVVDPRAFADKRCRSARDVRRAEGATVTISGTAGEWWDDPALTGCAVR
ncbi:MAG: hypothetical protein KIT31_39550 [Deltaproteobacteria bacterium]|nr:hypothetical protein [Deltaproteobacteria bacterium]